MGNVVLDKFIVDGVHWKWLPGMFSPKYDTHGVRSSSYPQLDLSRIVVTESSPNVTSSANIEQRRVHRQMWHAVWEQDAPMDLCMHDALLNLYVTQKGFWVQFDAEMSRADVQLLDLDGLGHTFFTPTYPIAPYGYVPGSSEGYRGKVRKNDGTWIQQFTVDSEIGRVEILNTDPEYTIIYPEYITMDYTWKAFVRIAAISLNPITITREFYSGEILFEQITPNYTYDPWTISYGCQTTLGSYADSTPSGGTIGLSNPSQASNPLSYPTVIGTISPTNNNDLTIFIATLDTGQSTDPSFGFGSGGSLLDSRIIDAGTAMSPSYGIP